MVEETEDLLYLLPSVIYSILHISKMISLRFLQLQALQNFFFKICMNSLSFSTFSNSSSEKAFTYIFYVICSSVKNNTCSTF